MKFSLQIQEHEEYGEFGIVNHNIKRDYFEPSITGFGVAHDILEHTVTPHENGYIDEFLALGSVLAGRIYSSWENQFGGKISIEDITTDVYSLAMSHLCGHNDDNFCPEVCRNYLQDSDLMENIRNSVIKGLLDAVNELEGESYTELPVKYDFDVDSIVGWICKGYQLFRRRFYNTDVYTISTYFFDKISDVCEKWLKSAYYGDTAELYLNFNTFEVRLEENY